MDSRDSLFHKIY